MLGRDERTECHKEGPVAVGARLQHIRTSQFSLDSGASPFDSGLGHDIASHLFFLVAFLAGESHASVHELHIVNKKDSGNGFSG
jgi:hypothetical protein